MVNIDDTGWGFPLGGIMIGVCVDENSIQTELEIIDIKYFQHPLFEQKKYTEEYSRVGFQLIEKLKIDQSMPINICSGFVNNEFANNLIQKGYNISRGKVEGLLQVKGEQIFSDYIYMLTKQNLYYDPKGMNKKLIGKAYYKAVNWATQNNTMLLKNGWNSLAKYRN